MSYQTDLYDAMVKDIITLTARPDLELETELALRTATNNVHLTDAYPRDVQQQVVQLPNPSFLAQLDIPSLFPQMRALSTMRLLDIDGQVVNFAEENKFRIVELGDIYDDYGNLRNNIAYIAGSVVNIRSYVNMYGLRVDWFKSPMIRREQYNSWIAQLYPDAILYWAASIVLDTNGNEAKAQKYMQMTQQIHIPFLRNNFLLGEMR